MKAVDLTKEEKRAISALRKLAQSWPDSLWLFSAAGELWVMRKKDGERAFNEFGGVDQEYAIVELDIENDGGDW